MGVGVTRSFLITECKQIATKHTSIESWRKGDPQSYRVALRRGILKEIATELKWATGVSAQQKLDLRRKRMEACTSVTEAKALDLQLRQREDSELQAELENLKKIQEYVANSKLRIKKMKSSQIFVRRRRADRLKVLRSELEREQCKITANQYGCFDEWVIADSSSYEKAKKNKWTAWVSRELGWVKIKPKSKEVVLSQAPSQHKELWTVALRYKNAKEWRKLDNDTYWDAIKKGLMAKIKFDCGWV